MKMRRKKSPVKLLDMKKGFQYNAEVLGVESK